MFIDVRIPWEPGKRLGYAFNRMMETVAGWVLVLDWDVLQLDINWYDKCLNAIKVVGDDAGLISCVTNRIGCPLQKSHSDKNNSNIDYHLGFSKSLSDRYTGIIEDVTEHKWKLSGFFFLTNKSVYEKIGPVPDDRFVGLDNWYHDRVKEAGYRIYIMHDLYVFHNYKRQWKKQGE